MRVLCLAALLAGVTGVAGCAHAAAASHRAGDATTKASHQPPAARSAPAVPLPAAASRPVTLTPMIARAGEGVVRFACRPSDAEVIVDGVTYGRVSDFEKPPYLTLGPGSHRITLRHRGYLSYHTEVYLSGSVIETVSASLTPLKVVAGTARETQP